MTCLEYRSSQIVGFSGQISKAIQVKSTGSNP
jgi:hypothetical protein